MSVRWYRSGHKRSHALCFFGCASDLMQQAAQPVVRTTNFRPKRMTGSGSGKVRPQEQQADVLALTIATPFSAPDRPKQPAVCLAEQAAANRLAARPAEPLPRFDAAAILRSPP